MNEVELSNCLGFCSLVRATDDNISTAHIYLTIYVLVDSSIRFDTQSLGWSIVYLEGRMLYFPNQIIVLSLEICFVLALCGISSGPSLFAKVHI